MPGRHTNSTPLHIETLGKLLNSLICKWAYLTGWSWRLSKKTRPVAAPHLAALSRRSVISSSPHNQIAGYHCGRTQPFESCCLAPSPTSLYYPFMRPWANSSWAPTMCQALYEEHRHGSSGPRAHETQSSLVERIKQTCLPTCFESCRSKAHCLSAAIWAN